MKAPSRSDPGADEQVTLRQFLQLFFATMLPMIMASMDQSLVATATPRVAAELGGLHDSSWISTAYLLTTAVTIPVYGRLGDRYGRREMLLAALAAYVCGSLVSGSAQSMTHLIIGRSLQGIGGGGLMSVSQTLVGELLPARQRARFQGYFAALFTTTSVIGPVLGGFVVAHASWRWLFFMNPPLAVLAAWRVAKLGRGERHPHAPGVDDRIGLMLFVLAMASLLYGLSSAGHRFAWLSWQSGACLAVSVATWSALVVVETRQRAPFFPIDLLGIRPLRLTLVTTFCNTFCFLPLVFYLPVYLQLGMHVEPGRSGVLLMPALIGLIIGGTTAGRIVARTGKPAPMPVIGLSAAALAMAGLALSPAEVTPVVAVAFFAALGFGPTLPMAQLVAQTVTERHHMGAALALVSLARTVGGMVGIAVLGAIIYGLLPDVEVARLMHSTASDARVARAFHAAFAVSALVAGLAAWNASRVPTVRI